MQPHHTPRSLSIRFAREFDLEVLNSTVVKEIEYDTREKVYTVVISCPSSFGERRVRAKHVVQATGVGSAVPYKPRLENEGVFKGTDLHSAQYKNPTDSLGEKVKVGRMDVSLVCSDSPVV